MAQSSRTNQGPTAQVSTPPRTCMFWAAGTCTMTAEQCEYAHNLYPVIVERSSPQGRKLAACNYGADCWWPREVCSFSHDTNEEKASEKRERLRILADEREWHASLRYTCKRCKKMFDEVQDVVEHCRTAHHQSFAPRWQESRDWRRKQ